MVGCALSATIVASGPGRAFGQTVLSVSPDTAMNRLFTTYGNSSTGREWTGGDGTSSVLLPDGTETWWFDDTFLGKVNAKGLRVRSRTPYIHNSVVLETNGALTRTLYGSATRHPTAWLNPVPKKPIPYGFWPFSEVVSSGVVYVSMEKIQLKKFGETINLMGTWIAAVNATTLQTESVRPVTSTRGINWSQELLSDGPWTYVYGEDGSHVYVARAPADEVAVQAQWTYYDGAGWATREAGAVPVMNHASPPFEGDFDVTEVGGDILALTMTGGQIEVGTAPDPWGPFGGFATVYHTPEQSAYPRSYEIATYGIEAHPELSAPNTLVVSYNVNGQASKAQVAHANVYRPRFLELTLASG